MGTPPAGPVTPRYADPDLTWLEISEFSLVSNETDCILVNWLASLKGPSNRREDIFRDLTSEGILCRDGT